MMNDAIERGGGEAADRLPADRGVASLGLLMQLAGNAFAVMTGLATLYGLVALGFPRHGENGLLLVMALLSLVRAIVHREAGLALALEARPGAPAREPLRAVRRYVAAGLVHAAVIAGILVLLGAPPAFALAAGAGLAVWPLALAVLVASGPLAGLEDGVPRAADRGLAGASVVMAVLAAAGAIGGGAVLLATCEAMAHGAAGPVSLAALAALALLLARSLAHAAAARAGLHAAGLDRAARLARRYTGLGVFAAIAGGVVLMGAALSVSRAHFGVLAQLSAAVWILALWPLHVRRFFEDRELTEVVEGAAPPAVRSPDSGLASLGWLLVAHAALGAGLAIPSLAAPGSGTSGLAWLLGGEPAVSPWWASGAIALEAWAGYELVRMGPRHRAIAAGFAVAATAVNAIAIAPVAAEVREALVLRALLADPTTALGLALVALQVAIPLATLALVARPALPAARARFRRGGAA